MLVFARVSLFALALAGLHAQDWTSLRAEGLRLQQAGKYQAALRSFLAALATVDRANGPTLAVAWTDLGVIHHKLDDYGEARSAFARALKILEKDPSTPALRLAIAYNNLAGAEMLLGRYTSAQRFYDHALEMYERAPVAADQLADILNNIGSQYHRRGLYHEAQPYFRRALERTPEGSLASAAYLTNYGGSALELGEYAEARRHLNAALEIRRRALGPHHPDTAKTLYYLGLCAYRQHDFATARELYERVIAVETAAFGPNNQDLGVCYANYAAVLRKLHRKADALVAERNAAAALQSAPVSSRSTVDVLSLMPEQGDRSK